MESAIGAGGRMRGDAKIIFRELHVRCRTEAAAKYLRT
jgi:hypothetical protein